MRVVLDTNVLVSGIFFGGIPRALLDAWVDTPVPTPITADPDDDKFLACAAEHGALVISGDPHLRDASGWHGVRVLSPRAFMTYLDETAPGVE